MASVKRVRLAKLAGAAGMAVFTYAPGDGVTRYRFTFDGRSGDTQNDYFACRAEYTALGIAEALAYAEGAAAVARRIG